jgi:hypothetical protein
MKVKDLPSTITTPFTSLAPAFNCIKGTAVLNYTPFNYNTGVPDSDVIEGIEINGTYTTGNSILMPLNWSEKEYVEHYFNTKYVSNVYDLNATWKSLFGNSDQSGSADGSYNVWITKGETQASSTEEEFDTLLPYERCCYEYEKNNAIYMQVSYNYHNDSNLHTPSNASTNFDNFYLAPNDLYTYNSWNYEDGIGYRETFHDLIGTYWSTPLGGGNFYIDTGGIFGIHQGLGSYKQSAEQTTFNIIINDVTYEGLCHIDVAGRDHNLTGTWNLTYNNYKYNI